MAQTGFVIATLVHQAALMLDAIVRTLWRLAVTRRRLLEWIDGRAGEPRKPEMNLVGFYRWMCAKRRRRRRRRRSSPSPLRR